MKLNIDSDWLRSMAEKEDGCIISVGGLVTRIQENQMSESPKYKTLKELVEAIKQGVVSKESVLIIDNDSATMYDVPEDESEDDWGELLFDGDMPACLLKEALDLLGVPNQPA